MKHFLREEEKPRQEENYIEFLNNFRSTGKVWIDKNKLDIIIQEASETYVREYQLTRHIMGTKSLYYKTEPEKRDSVIEYLRIYEGCTDDDFASRKRGGSKESIGKDIRARMIEKGKAVEFLSQYDKMAEAKTLRDKLNKLPKSEYCSLSEYKSEEGSELYELTYQLSEIKNRRVATEKYNVIGFPKDKAWIITVRKGYTLFQGDLPQADLRIAINLVLSNKELLALLESEEDAYKALAKGVYSITGQVYEEEQYQATRKTKKMLSLGTLYGKKEAEDIEGKEWIESMDMMLDKDERYQIFKRNIVSKKEAGLPIYSESYFGYRQHVVASVRGTGENASEGDILNAALNSPMQTGTSELIILTVNSICRQFRDLGLMQGVDFDVLMVRYDEPIFWLKDELIEDYAWVFKDHNKLIIDDFTPITLDFEATKSYTVKDPVSQAKYLASIEKHKDKINTQLKPFTSTIQSYVPVLGTLIVGFGYYKVSDGYVCALVSEDGRYTTFKFSDDIPEEDLMMEVAVKLKVNINGLHDNYYDSVKVYNTLEKNITTVGEGELVIDFESEYHMITGQAMHVAYVIAYLSEKRAGKDISMFKESELFKAEHLMSPKGTKLGKLTFLGNN